jgi:ABC-type antimicrobial peptide transport system permease subunit
LAIGVPVAFLCVRYVESQLYEMKALDATVLLGSILVLVTAATLAGLIPARRASSIDPARALRTE